MPASAMGPARLPRFTIRQLNRLLDSEAISSEQLCSYCSALASAGERAWELNAFASLVQEDEWREQARQSDARRRRKESFSLLDGIPISIKANIAVATQPLTAGSRILGAGGTSPSPPPPVGYDATVSSALLQRGGAVLIGTTNLDEFGMGSLGANVVSRDSAGNEVTRPTKNPLPFLRDFMGEHGDVSLMRDRGVSDEQAVDILRNATPDAILEAHCNTLNSNSYDTDEPYYSAGGSSCGSACSVSHGSSILSIGSDTGGSVRLPAAWCGVFGLKPSYGLLSRHGLVAYASSLDTIGMLAPTADCIFLALREVLEAQQQTPRMDSTQCQHIPPSLMKSSSSGEDDIIISSSPLDGLKVGIPEAFSVVECPSELRRAWSSTALSLRKLGASIHTVSNDVIDVAIVQKSLAAYYVLVSGEASSNLARYDGLRYGVSVDNVGDLAGNEATKGWSMLEQRYAATRTRGFGSEVARRVLCGTSVLSSDRYHTYYEAATKLRSILTKQLNRALDEYCDVLLVPTAVFPPVRFVKDARIDPTEILANDVMTVPASLAGLPAMSIPAEQVIDDKEGGDSNAPFPPALQLIGPRLGESTVLRIARALQNDAANPSLS